MDPPEWKHVGAHVGETPHVYLPPLGSENSTFSLSICLDMPSPVGLHAPCRENSTHLLPDICYDKLNFSGPQLQNNWPKKMRHKSLQKLQNCIKVFTKCYSWAIKRQVAKWQAFTKAKVLRFLHNNFDQVFDKSASYPFRLSKHTRKLQVTSDTKIKRKYKVFQKGMFFDCWNVFFGG